MSTYQVNHRFQSLHDWFESSNKMLLRDTLDDFSNFILLLFQIIQHIRKNFNYTQISDTQILNAKWRIDKKLVKILNELYLSQILEYENVTPIHINLQASSTTLLFLVILEFGREMPHF